jgi:perosamine synthetase
MISHSRPLIHPDDVKAVTEVIESGMLAMGEKVHAFEHFIASYIGTNQAVAVSSGTAALYLSLSALGIGPGDDVVIPAYVCPALLHAVRMTGARPIIADSGDDIYHMDVTTIKNVLTTQTKTIIFPHQFGSANDIHNIIALGIPVIEDCSVSLGSALNGIKTGNSGSYAAVFSFYATKVIATGEGGMVLSHDTSFIERIRDRFHYADKSDDIPRFNFKMTDIAAALGLSQMRRLESMIERRRELKTKYSKRFDGLGLILPSEHPGERHIFYRFVVRTDKVDNLIKEIKNRGVSALRPVATPISHFPGIGYSCPRAEEAWQTTLSIPLYPALTDSEAEKVITAVVNALT